LASGQLHLTKNAPVKNASNAASCVTPTFNGSKNRARSPTWAVSQNFPLTSYLVRPFAHPFRHSSCPPSSSPSMPGQQSSNRVHSHSHRCRTCPSSPQHPATRPALPSPPVPTNVATNSMRPQQRREKRQRRDAAVCCVSVHIARIEWH